MNQIRDPSQKATLMAENIGGIDETEVTFSLGINVLVGRNATNRTSLLQALMAVLGSEEVSLKGDADQGHVELSIDDETYTRTLTRTNGAVSFDGEPYLHSDETDVADLFSFLLETNEARQAVAQQHDLHDVIMGPVDTAAIQSQIRELEQEKQELDTELNQLKNRKRKLPDLEQRRTGLERQIKEKRKQLEAKEAELQSVEDNIDDEGADQSERDEKLEELQETRTKLEEVRLDIETQNESLSALHEERERFKNKLADIAKPADKDITDIEGEIERLRSQKQAIDATLSELQTIIQFNEEMLDGTSSDIATAIRNERTEKTTQSVTDALVEDSNQVTCWTCGSEVETEQIETTLERLRTLRQNRLSEQNTLTDEIVDLEAEKRKYETAQRERAELQQRLTQVETEIDSREETLADLKQQQESLRDEVNHLEKTVEELETTKNDELLSLHKETNQMEFELSRLKSDLEDVEDEIKSIENELDREEELIDQREEVQSKLQNLRSRIDQIEDDAVSRFNDHMETILNILNYANINRIWIERIEQQASGGRQKPFNSQFELHVVRETAKGAIYEDTVDHLSESEREVTGLVFALAGYLVHDVHETVPFMLLDSLEAIDSERIARLIEYFHEYVPYLVIALLPADAAALDDEHHRITAI